MTTEYPPPDVSALAPPRPGSDRPDPHIAARRVQRTQRRQLANVYSDDANWVNAFGSVKHGRQEIITYLCGLFADANFTAGTLKATPRAASAYSQ